MFSPEKTEKLTKCELIRCRGKINPADLIFQRVPIENYGFGFHPSLILSGKERITLNALHLLVISKMAELKPHIKIP